MLCLSEQDIFAAAGRDEIMDAVESAMLLYERQEFEMPQRMHVDYQGNVFLLMPCLTKESIATKLVSLFPDNPAKGLPVLMGVVVLNDGQTGKPKALLDGAMLTSLRTGAVGGVSIRHLAGDDVRALGVVGAGVQGFYQSLFACTARPFSEIRVFDQFPEKAAGLAEKLSASLSGVQVHAVDAVEALVSQSDVVITATNSQKPVLPDDEGLLRGRHYVGIGSYKPDMREYPGTLFSLLNRMYIDTRHAMEESGDLMDPLKNGWITQDRILTLGKLIGESSRADAGAGIQPANRKARTTLFKTVGMALFDLVVTDMIYEKAAEKGLGQEVDLWPN